MSDGSGGAAVRGFFVTGTDTGVGKTFVTALLVRAARGAGLRACGYKPVACGDRGDAVALQEAGGGELALEAVNPVYLKAPASPLAAAMLEGREAAVDPAGLVRGFEALAAEHDLVIVEGAGGWEVPLAPGHSMADLAVALALPVIVVVHNRLGALNHTVLTARAVQSRGLPVAGLVLNYPDDERDSASISNRAILEQVLPEVPVLAEVMHGEEAMEWPEGLGIAEGGLRSAE